MSRRHKRLSKRENKNKSNINDVITHHIDKKSDMVMAFGIDVGKFFVAVSDEKVSVFLTDAGTNEFSSIDVFDFLRFLNISFDDGLVNLFFCPNLIDRFISLNGKEIFDNTHIYSDTDSMICLKTEAVKGILVWRNCLTFIPEKDLDITLENYSEINDIIIKEIMKLGFLGLDRTAIQTRFSAQFYNLHNLVSHGGAPKIIYNILQKNLMNDVQISSNREELINKAKLEANAK